MGTKKKYQLVIGWLYPELMSTYGDIGNIHCMVKRCQWRGIDVQVIHFALDDWKAWDTVNLLFMGGAQDRQQGIVSKDLTNNDGVKAALIKDKMNAGIPGLFICGAYQFMGSYYKTSDGTKLPGLGLFDLYTEHPGEGIRRLIGNIATMSIITDDTLIGFENHGGRTYLGASIKPFAKVIAGFGNNGKDGYEGAMYHNCIGTYLHGPLLPKNPQLTDWLIARSLEVKYSNTMQLPALDDTIEKQARTAMFERLRITNHE